MKKVHSSGFMVNSGLFFLVLYATCYAQSISSTELINNAKEYDGKSVVYAGEVIGDVMVRGDFAWINLNDGQNAIGIWLDKELAKEIQYTGSYQTKGERVEITGVFQRNCIQHGGDMDIHAQGLRKISLGKLVQEKIDTVKRNFAIILLGILFIVLIFVRRQGSRPNKSQTNPASIAW